MSKELMGQVRKHRSPSKTLYERIVEVQDSALAVEVKEDGQWRMTLHPSEAAAEWFISHTENETRRVGR